METNLEKILEEKIKSARVYPTREELFDMVYAVTDKKTFDKALDNLVKKNYVLLSERIEIIWIHNPKLKIDGDLVIR